MPASVAQGVPGQGRVTSHGEKATVSTLRTGHRARLQHVHELEAGRCQVKQGGDDREESYGHELGAPPRLAYTAVVLPICVSDGNCAVTAQQSGSRVAAPKHHPHAIAR
jgi:hypothetical protein